jgi:hypothetical protein
MTNLMHKFLIHLLQSSTCTCFEQYLAHHQEVNLLIQHLVSSLSVNDRPVHSTTTTTTTATATAAATAATAAAAADSLHLLTPST